MLTLTDDARTAVDDLAARAGVPQGGGLRITGSSADEGVVDLALVRHPMPDDTVLDSGTTPVFVESSTLSALDDLTLDADLAEGTGFRLVRD